MLFMFLHQLNTYRLPWTTLGFDTSTSLPFRGPQALKFRDQPVPPVHSFSTEFRSGTPNQPGLRYTQIVVVPRLTSDDVTWIEDELPGIDTIFYVANDPTATPHPPRNKGHEVMVYLTYIIDHYTELPDTVIFMHAHRWTHHNVELLGHDSAQMIRRLSNDYVAREGYVNMRCRWYPGCPGWLNPNDTRETIAKQEQVVLFEILQELFPSESKPEALGQTCCAQFALSRNRILSIPLSRFIFYRDWILRTPLSDYVSGRIWEYLWQYIFTGQGIYCPSEHICLCQGFGVCFRSDAEYREFEELRDKKKAIEGKLKGLQEKQAVTKKEKDEAYGSVGPAFLDSRRSANLTSQIEVFEKDIAARRQAAIERGAIPENRAGWSDEQWAQRNDF